MLRFRCYRCVHCCFFASDIDYPIVTERDRRTLERVARKRGVELTFRRIGRGLYQWVIDGFCPFYSVRERACTIYEVRPTACRMYPLLLNPATGEVSMSALCDWVAKHLSELLEVENPVEVFREEFPQALSLFKLLASRGPTS